MATFRTNAQKAIQALERLTDSPPEQERIAGIISVGLALVAVVLFAAHYMK